MLWRWQTMKRLRCAHTTTTRQARWHLIIFMFCCTLISFPLQRRLNVDCFNISPDLNFILLYECEAKSSNGTRYTVYEVYSATTFALSLNESANDEVELQQVLWSPETTSFTASRKHKALPSRATVEKSKISQAIAFVNEYDVYYKPKVHTDAVMRITFNGELLLTLFFLVIVFV